MPSVEGVDDNVPPTGYGVRGSSNRGGVGVLGRSNNIGVQGVSDSGQAVYGYSPSGTGITGDSWSGTSVHGFSRDGVGVWGSSSSHYGVYGVSSSNIGVVGGSTNSIGVYGDSNSVVGVYGNSNSGTAVFGISPRGYGVHGRSYEFVGVKGDSNTGVAVSGESNGNIGVYGGSNRSYGVFGFSSSHYGVYGRGGTGAAYLQGNVRVTGRLQKGGGSFKIDHPLDPANKYLSHSFVESPDMKNVYDGTVVLDNKGEAEIQLPDWFGALNKDFRYQLTAIGAPGPNLYIAEEIFDGVTNYSNSSSSNDKNNNSRFKIAGGTLGMKVSWQVTGIRKDPWANANRILVEEDKPAKEQGYYIHPDLYGQPEEKGISQLLFPREEKWQEVPVR
jgi:hypothetical protein